MASRMPETAASATTASAASHASETAQAASSTQTARTAFRTAQAQVNMAFHEISRAGIRSSGTADFLCPPQSGTPLPVPHILVKVRR